jgi:transmembrane sensor
MQEQSRDPLIEEALRWLVVLKDRAASDDDRAAFHDWLQADPSHQAAWTRAQGVWMRVGKFGPAFANRPAAVPGRLPAAATPAARPALATPSLAGPAGLPGRRRLLHAAAAVAVVAAPAAVLLSRPDLFADHGTAVGERRKVTLADGSTVELAGSSSLSVDFSTEARRVVLHDGEAFFDVARDGTRPFVVRAADGSSQALGTSFDIKRQGTEVTVAVVEHAVVVSSAGGRVVVEQGQQIRYGARRVDKVRDADLAQVEAWRHDRLIFQGTPLGEVIADLERYRGGRIVLTDGRLRDIPVTAVFDARQADAALDTIANALAIRLRRVTGLLVVLSPNV